MSDIRWTLKLVLGVVMIGLGAFVGVRPLLPNHAILTGSRWLDVAFAAFFILRGGMNVRSALRARRQAP